MDPAGCQLPRGPRTVSKFARQSTRRGPRRSGCAGPISRICVAQDVAAGFEEALARRKWRAALEERVLEPSFELRFRDKGTVTVAKVLESPADYDFERLADPADPGCYGDYRIAQFYANAGQNGRPQIWSWAHGGCKYALRAP